MSRVYTNSQACPSVRRLQARRAKKKNRRRARCLAFLALFVTVMCTIAGTAANATKISDTEKFYVSNGDTLWSIASYCNTENKDIRSVMDDIMKLNHMRSAQLHIGDELIIPVY